jgi:ABC-type sugar transport system substrate-binding protein
MHQNPALRRFTLGVAAAGTAALLLAGCSTPAAETGGGDLADTTVALVGYGDASPWGAHYNKIYIGALEEEGVEVLDLTSMDPGTQVQNFNQAVSQQPDVIVTLLWDTAAMVAPIKKAIAAGIPVIVVDGPADPSIADEEGLYAVLSDNVALGEIAATNIIEGMKAQGLTEGNVIVVSGTTSMLVTQDRMDGFNSVFEANPGFEIIDVQDSNWDPTAAGDIARQLLAKYGPEGVQGAYGMADYLAIPIINAAKELGFAVNGENGLIVSGGNCFKVGIDSIKAGELYGTATEDPGTIAQEAADYTASLLKGEDVERVVLVEEFGVTADNVDEYAEQCSNA